MKLSADALAALRIDRSRQRRRTAPWLALGVVAVLVLAALGWRVAAGWQEVGVATARAEPLSAVKGAGFDGRPELTAAGYVVADRQSVLAAKFTGRLAKLHVAEAQFVAEGAVVAELDHAELDATIAQAEAEVLQAAAEVERLGKLAAQARAERLAAEAALETLDAEMQEYLVLLADAKRRLALNEKLSARYAIAASEVDDRRTEVGAMEAKVAWTRRRRIEAERHVAVVEAQAGAAEAAVAAAEARRDSAAARVRVLESQREEHLIRAPFSGRVTEKAAEVGEIVAPISIGGSMARGSIVTIADWSSLQAEVDVAESQLSRVAPGQDAEITVDALPDRTFKGKVRRILPRADRSKATVKVRVDFLDRDHEGRDRTTVLPEMGVRVRFLPLPGGAAGAGGSPGGHVVVPRAAVQSGPEGGFVWVVDDGVARKQAVEIGRTAGQHVVVTRGLDPGAAVVVRGAERLSGRRAAVRVEE